MSRDEFDSIIYFFRYYRLSSDEHLNDVLDKNLFYAGDLNYYAGTRSDRLYAARFRSNLRRLRKYEQAGN